MSVAVQGNSITPRPHGLTQNQHNALQTLSDYLLNGETQFALNFLTSVFGSSTHYSVIACDLLGTILLWNEGASRIYGYDENEAVSRMNVSDLYTPEDVAADLPRQLMRIALGNERFEGTVTRKRKNGELFIARLLKTVRRDAAGEPAGFLLVSIDVSEESRSTKYARSLIEASLEPVVTITAQGTITEVNEAATKITGTPRETLVGTSLYNYFTEPGSARKECLRAFSEGTVSDLPLTIRHANGDLTDVLCKVSVYCDDSGNVAGVVAAARDVTVQKPASQYARSLIEASPDPLVML